MRHHLLPADQCLVFATVDLPQNYRGRLTSGESLPHLKTLLHHQGVHGLRFNLTKSWYVGDARAAIHAAQRAQKSTMVDLIGKLRIRPRNTLGVEVAAGQLLVVAVSEANGSAPFHFTRPLDLASLTLGQPVVIRDGRALGSVTAIDHGVGTVTIGIDSTERPLLRLLEPPISLPGFGGVDRRPTARDLQWLSLVVHGWGVTHVALSFVEDLDVTADLCEKISRLAREARRALPVAVLKIETRKGVTNLPAILDVLCRHGWPIAVEIARGDLDNDVNLALPHAQERIFAVARERGVPVGVATGLLASMRTSPSPARAEKIDVWTCLRAGAAFLVLTDETANESQRPERVVETLADIITRFREAHPAAPHTKGIPQ